MPPEDSNLVSSILSKAENALSHGPVGLGENHTSSEARTVTIALIQRGRVDKLFLEVMPFQGRVVAEKADLEKLRFMESGSSVSRGGEATIGIADVVAAALDKGVQVYYHDFPLTAPPGFIPGSQAAKRNTPGSASPQGIRARNLHSAEVIIKNGGGGRKSLILGGAAHFAHSKCDGRDFINLLAFSKLVYFDCRPQWARGGV